MAEVNTLNSEIKIAVIGGDERQLITATGTIGCWF